MAIGGSKTLHSRVRYEITPEDHREAIVMFLKAKYGVTVEPKNVTDYDGSEFTEYIVAYRMEQVGAKA